MIPEREVAAVVARLVVPDACMPSQINRRSENRPPIIRLFSAVLDEAFRNLKTDTDMGKAARKWFRSRDSRWPFSFLFVCEVLEIDPSTFRKLALRVARKKLKVASIVRRHVVRSKSDARRLDEVRDTIRTRRYSLRSGVPK